MTDPAPLEIRIAPRKERVIAGEGIVLDLFHEIQRDVELETVELNLDRTRIHVASGGESRVLTGRDHKVLHRKGDLEPIGFEFEAAKGDAWDSPLDLTNFARPFTPGRYRIEVEYRFGDGPDDSVRSNAVEVDVEPASVSGATFRWFGAADARGELATIWCHDGEDGPHWIYQTANALDPSAVISSVDLGRLPTLPASPVRLALLNDIAHFHFERYAAWVQRDGLGWLKVQPAGPIGDPQVAEHGLASSPTPRLVEPPLHCGDGGICAVVSGLDDSGASACSLVRVDKENGAQHRVVHSSGGGIFHSCIVWHSWVETPQASLVRCGPPESDGSTRVILTDLSTGAERLLGELRGRVEHLFAEQWLGRGRIVAVTRDGDGFGVFAWDIEDLERPVSPMASIPDEDEVYRDAALLDSDMTSDPRDHALLLSVDDHCVVLTSSLEIGVPPGELDELRPLRLVASPRGELFVVVDAGADGPRVIALGHARPESSL